MIINPPKKSAANLQAKTITPSTLEQIITPDTGYDGLSKVTAKRFYPAITQYGNIDGGGMGTSTDGKTIKLNVLKSALNDDYLGTPTIGGIDDIFLIHIVADDNSKLTDNDIEEQMLALRKSSGGTLSYICKSIFTKKIGGTKVDASNYNYVASNTGFSETSTAYEIPMEISYNDGSYTYSTQTNYKIQLIGRNMSV